MPVAVNLAMTRHGPEELLLPCVRDGHERVFQLFVGQL